jgi:hypothetical protein
MIVFNTIIGLAFFAFLYIGIIWRHSFRWRYLADFYAGDGGPPIETRRLQGVVLIGPVAYESLHRIVHVSAHKTGIGLRMMLPFSLFRTPLFIPFGDIEGWATTWYLDAPSSELSLRRAPDVKVVISQELAQWLAGYSGRKFTLHDVPPPQGKAGQGWRRFVLGVLIYMAIGMVTLLGVTLWKWAG